ncbi:DNA polymerase Y family protein [Aggregicoccus sp. 17bor-14]|uniref:Y-family DNA polymerase n=1 Tax=Myxococcaceae TaxID=31 RepID=UPI00129C5F19|nr:MULTISPECIES: DNA polymerase Y family protein [Myxococcaceae]MBF5040983.1 DNA polymerase Y family protein [Simulacricoccus sp. 17bor-14]MRI86770.1 DNA polymerase Y family protein [Aggregicoccus sp. 17bor-14]
MRRAYLHLPRFAAQRRVLEQPALGGQPFALTEEVRGQRRIACASSAALRAGVQPGMTLTAASALLPTLQPFTLCEEDEWRALRALGEALLVLAPGFQLCPPDGMWLDASAAPLAGGEAGLAERVLQLCAERGYRGGVAVASEAFTARALARHGGRVQTVEAGQGGRALAPLPLSALEEHPARAAFVALGLSTLGEVAALPAGAVAARGGAQALRAHALCRGADDTPFVAEALEEVVEERLSLDFPAESFEPVQFALKTLLDRLCARLGGRRRAAVRLRFELLLDPSGRAVLPLTLARPSAQARLLLDLARHRFENLRLERPVAGLVARVEEDCEDPGQQLSLGDGPQGDAALEVVLSRLASTLGEGALFSAAVQPVHRPEQAYSPCAFRPPRAARGLLADLLPTSPLPLGEGGVQERPSRLVASPTPLDAELGPDGELRSARLQGARRRVVALTGPERLSGEWWAPAPYSRDYYRLHLEGLGPVWVFRDAADGRFYLQGFFD